MLYHVYCQIVTAYCGLLDPEDRGSITLQNSNNYFPVTWHNILKNLHHKRWENLKSYIVPGFDCTTVFTRMQDDFMTSPQKNKSAKGKCIYSNIRQTSKIKPLLKNIFLSLSPSWQSLPSSSSHSLLTSASFPLPFHNIPPSVLYTALDTQHFLKAFTVTSSEMRCHAIMIHTDWIIYLYFLVYKLTWTHKEDPQFSSHIVLVVLLVLRI